MMEEILHHISHKNPPLHLTWKSHPVYHMKILHHFLHENLTQFIIMNYIVNDIKEKRPFPLHEQS